MNNNINMMICQDDDVQEKEQSVLKMLEAKKNQQNKQLHDILTALKDTENYSDEIAERIINCGTYIHMQGQKITGANFCKHKLCPVCQWRKSRRVFGQISEVQKVLSKDYNYRYLFLTLTLKNVKDLQKGIEHILQAFKRLQDARTFRKTVKGYIRTLEITYNKDTKEWHPHIHTIIAVKNNYFTDSYLSQTEWASMWKCAADIDYNPIIDIRTITQDKEAAAVAEVAKYAVKPLDVDAAENKIQVYTDFLQATYKRRLRSMGGAYRKIAKQIGLLQDIELLDAEEEGKKTEVYKYNDNTKSFVLSQIHTDFCNNQEIVSERG